MKGKNPNRSFTSINGIRIPLKSMIPSSINKQNKKAKKEKKDINF